MAEGSGRRGKKQNYNKNHQANSEWTAWKKAGRPARPSKNPQVQAELIHRGLLVQAETR